MTSGAGPTPTPAGLRPRLPTLVARLGISVIVPVVAYLLLRPYLKRSVKIRVRDERDPAPYWLVSSRDPEHLAAAIQVISGTGPAR